LKKSDKINIPPAAPSGSALLPESPIPPPQ
jgi:hypothetical protein